MSDQDIDDLRETVERLEANIDAIGMAGKKRGERIEELEQENERLRDRVAELETVVSPDDKSKDFQALTREEKVFRLRVGLLEKAGNTSGAKMNYRDVMHYFQNHPSPGHCYDLMRDAANADGYDYNEDTGEKRLVVDTADVNDETLIHAANNDTQRMPA